MAVKVANIHLAMDYEKSSAHRSLCAEEFEGSGQGRECAKCNGQCPQNPDKRSINKEFPDLVKALSETVLILDKESIPARCLRST